MNGIYEMSFFNTDIYHVVHWFFLYSILGWLVESIYMSICNKKLTNRGFIRGPICPIYGVGALSVYFILLPMQGRYILLFIYGSLFATTLEFVTAILMIRVFGSLWWDYNDKPYNYKGILCLESSIAWGFYTVIMFGFLHKIISHTVESYTTLMGLQMGRFLASLFILYYLFAFSVKIIKVRYDNLPDSITYVRKVWNLIKK